MSATINPTTFILSGVDHSVSILSTSQNLKLAGLGLKAGLPPMMVFIEV
jgi:hypothetical protein